MVTIFSYFFSINADTYGTLNIITLLDEHPHYGALQANILL